MGVENWHPIRHMCPLYTPHSNGPKRISSPNMYYIPILAYRSEIGALSVVGTESNMRVGQLRDTFYLFIGNKHYEVRLMEFPRQNGEGTA